MDRATNSDHPAPVTVVSEDAARVHAGGEGAGAEPGSGEEEAPAEQTPAPAAAAAPDDDDGGGSARSRSCSAARAARSPWPRSSWRCACGRPEDGSDQRGDGRRAERAVERPALHGRPRAIAPPSSAARWPPRGTTWTSVPSASP